ncbi:MAG: 1,2-phenylacetyl-CoA epoxidase subunit PaaD [Flavobacterium sp.]|uniref:1,2-phenylacetyl-CoA epoxidase subunit PaaD n=1 Tax=Flavobacterium sp. TaxID=239 RepID=UPI0022C3E430|nr:1,2-phenylacetyl-CoA epoxidase subunit PaaD [Flavobacterium sp.]MCZ8169017.1 phenylacetate-CoA oxygenase subunit PaaJ [Flavobacterium sp.]MCZ8297193.1 phenylacetate-CoA oxygenase subunit PaaJ [Flavobacterium sp.]
MKTLPPQINAILESVSDPEIPVLSIMDMGVVREVEVQERDVFIKITPTYSGCPAMDTIADDIKAAFAKEGYQAQVKLILAPAWSTDWITERGRKALEAYGIAAPLNEEADKEALLGNKKIVKCPQCGSTHTRLVSQFGSTACKALFQCEACHEPFDYFKCLK